MKIKLKYKDVLLDGGTITYTGSDGKLYYEDHRLGTITEGKIYDGYPDRIPSRILNEYEYEIEEHTQS